MDFEKICNEFDPAETVPVGRLMRAYRGNLVIMQSDYERVTQQRGQSCLLTAYGSGMSSWYLYHRMDGVLVVIVSTCFGKGADYHCRGAPREWEIVNDVEL